MRTRLAVVAGLILGALVAAGLLVAVISFVPDGSVAGATPSPMVPSPSLPSPFASPAPSGSGSPRPESAPPAPSAPAASASAAAGNFHVGEPAPALRVPQVGGGEVDLATLRGKPVWVNFMATWCPPCVDEMPLMNGFAARYEDQGLVVVAIDVREEVGLVAPFVQGLHVGFPVGLDEDGSAQDAWGAFALPVHFWVDAEGVVRDGALGGIGPDIMATGLESILPGVDVTP